jgi:myo-inositol-1(or 4)-monophosphatase
MELEQLCNKVKDIARDTGEFILEEQKNFSSSDYETKGRQNFVTHVDTGAERILVRELKKLLPEAGFITEEGTVEQSVEDYQWIIDPIDGTTNFIHGLPPYAICIALSFKGEVILGVVYELGLKEFFYSWKGGKAYMNGEEIRVSKTDSVGSSLIATGFPYTYFDRLDPFMYSIRYFMQNSHGLRRLGSAATDLVYVACGRVDAFYEYGLNAWDVAAATFIILQAGGVACDFYGNEDWLFGGTIIAANASVHDEFKEVIHKIFIKEEEI